MRSKDFRTLAMNVQQNVTGQLLCALCRLPPSSIAQGNPLKRIQQLQQAARVSTNLSGKVVPLVPSGTSM